GDNKLRDPIKLRKIAAYGSRLAGEAYVAPTGPVISKVLAQVADYGRRCLLPNPLNVPTCLDKTEVLEIYNPTDNTYEFGPGGIQVVYCGTSSPSCQTQDFSSGWFTKAHSPPQLLP